MKRVALMLLIGFGGFTGFSLYGQIANKKRQPACLAEIFFTDTYNMDTAVVPGSGTVVRFLLTRREHILRFAIVYHLPIRL